MNPFTKFLRQWVQSRPLNDFVNHWDQLEMIVIQVYREKMTLTQAEPLFAQVWPQLQRQYKRRWQAALQPYWPQTQVAGQPTQIDPFQLLLDLPNPAAIQGNWQAMQHLPAAREALNQYILSITQ